MKKWFDALLTDKRWAWIISLAVGFAAWYMVMLTTTDKETRIIAGIPIDFSNGSEIVSQMQLQPIGNSSNTTCSVKVRATPVVLGTITAEDIHVTPSMSNVTGAGTFELTLNYRNDSGKEFTIEEGSGSPRTVSVKFDRLKSQQLPVTVDINGLSTPEGYMTEKETVNPSTVTISGPEADISKVDKCMVKLDLSSEVIDSPKVYHGEIVLLDADGNEVGKQNISMDVATAEVVIPVKKLVELPLRLEFTNVPDGFPIDELRERYSLSNESVRVAGIPGDVDKYTEIPLGYLDLRSLDLTQDYTFDIKLPDGFTDLSNIKSVVVTFDAENMETTEFTINKFTLLNVPTGYEASVLTEKLNITLMGDKDILETVTASDIIAEINLSERSVQAGQFSMPVTVYLPTKGLVWAQGEYQAVVSVKEE